MTCFISTEKKNMITEITVHSKIAHTKGRHSNYLRIDYSCFAGILVGLLTKFYSFFKVHVGILLLMLCTAIEIVLGAGRVKMYTRNGLKRFFYIFFFRLSRRFFFFFFFFFKIFFIG